MKQLNSFILNDSNPSAQFLFPVPLNNLKDGLPWIKSWIFFSENGSKEKHVPCVQGLIISITSIVNLWTNLKNKEYLFLRTAQLNQDPLENLFSTIRTRGGYDPNPNVCKFRQNLQHKMHISFIKSCEKSNCLEDNSEDIILDLTTNTTSDEHLGVEHFSDIIIVAVMILIAQCQKMKAIY